MFDAFTMVEMYFLVHIHQKGRDVHCIFHLHVHQSSERRIKSVKSPPFPPTPLYNRAVIH